MKSEKTVLFLLVIAQFFCTSMWFAGNSVSNQLMEMFQLTEESIGVLTSAVQFGFITGTILFALFTVVDRYSPSFVFMICGILGAFGNLLMLWEGGNLSSLVLSRFITGFFLSGIYPVGMKIATDYFQKGLGKSLGYLVGALVLGTALPHLLKGFFIDISWKYVVCGTSILSTLGGILVFTLVKDGPFRTASQKLDFSAFLKVFRDKNFKTAAIGYFGHMWELYAFWTFIPFLIDSFNNKHSFEIDIPLFSFFIIGIGSISCVIAGYLAHRFGTKKMATSALLLSGICCLLSPLVLQSSSIYLFLLFILFWGFMVVADSPLFSTLVAQNTKAKTKGTALIIVTSLGYVITIISIQLLTSLCFTYYNTFVFTILAIGPAIGVFSLIRNKNLV